MPPLSLTQSKYAPASLPTVVKSTPGISMSMPPSLIGVPVAFFPVPIPQMLCVAEAVPEPTGPAALTWRALPAQAAAAIATMQTAASPARILIFLDLIDLSSLL